MRDVTLAIAFVAVGIVSFGVGELLAHDLFLRPVSFFVAPGGEILLRMLNGSFTSSEGGVTRPRVRDLRVMHGAAAEKVDTTSLEVGKNESVLHVKPRDPGTYLIGISLLPRTIRLEAKDFNEYLRTDGIPSVLELRRTTGELERPARERYSKHVKSLVQVGSKLETVGAVLGYPAELVPLDNPYARRGPQRIRLRALVDGRVVAGIPVLFGGIGSDGKSFPERSALTGSDGVAVITATGPGKWYAKFIDMRPVRSVSGDSVDYESKWATLTFGTR